jgi:hypothetical protein
LAHGKIFRVYQAINVTYKNGGTYMKAMIVAKKALAWILANLIILTPFTASFAQETNSSTAIRVDAGNLIVLNNIPQPEKSIANYGIAIPSASSTLAEWFDFLNNPRVANILPNLNFNISNASGMFTVYASEFAFKKELPFNLPDSEITIDRYSITPKDYDLATSILVALGSLEYPMLFKRCYPVYAAFRYAQNKLAETGLAYTELSAKISVLLGSAEAIYSQVRAGNGSLEIQQSITRLMLRYDNEVGKIIDDASRLLYIKNWLNKKRALKQPSALPNGTTIYDYQSKFFTHLPTMEQVLQGKLTPGLRMDLEAVSNRLDFLSANEMMISDLMMRSIPGGNTFLGMYSKRGKIIVCGIWLDPILDIALFSAIGAIAARGTAIASAATTAALLSNGAAQIGIGIYTYREMGNMTAGKIMAGLFVAMGLVSLIAGVNSSRIMLRNTPVYAKKAEGLFPELTEGELGRGPAQEVRTARPGNVRPQQPEGPITPEANRHLWTKKPIGEVTPPTRQTSPRPASIEPPLQTNARSASPPNRVTLPGSQGKTYITDFSRETTPSGFIEEVSYLTVDGSQFKITRTGSGIKIANSAGVPKEVFDGIVEKIRSKLSVRCEVSISPERPHLTFENGKWVNNVELIPRKSRLIFNPELRDLILYSFKEF